MRRLAPVLGSVVTLMALGGCGGGHKVTPPAPTTTPSSSIPAPTTTGSPATASSTTSTNAPTTTVAGSTLRITAYTVSPASPVTCNAPTMVELQWTSVGATAVDLSIDGRLFATYGGGAQKHLEYLACDGEPHTYLLTARAGSARTTSSLVVDTIKS